MEGSVYLLYLGIQLLLTNAAQLQTATAAPQSPMRLFVTGAVSNISNPKIAVFYFAFLPQFIGAGATHPTLTIFVLGILFAALTFLIKGPVAFFAGRLSSWFQARPAPLRWSGSIGAVAWS